MVGNSWIMVSDLCYHFLPFAEREVFGSDSLGKQTETF